MFRFPNLDEPLWSLNLASGGSLAAPPLISSCFALWNSEKVMEAGGLPIRNWAQNGLHVQEPHRTLLGIKLRVNREGSRGL